LAATWAGEREERKMSERTITESMALYHLQKRLEAREVVRWSRRQKRKRLWLWIKLKLTAKVPTAN
jgi:hypothetical protein